MQILKRPTACERCIRIRPPRIALRPHKAKTHGLHISIRCLVVGPGKEGSGNREYLANFT